MSTTTGWTTLAELEYGAIFETRNGVRAVKSRYHYNHGAPQCVLLASGEYAHFPGGAAEPVREIAPLVDDDALHVTREEAAVLEELLDPTIIHRTEAQERVLARLRAFLEGVKR